jgi:hypothetical protein
MGEDKRYNGWTNYETWRVNLEFFDGDFWNERAEEMALELLDKDGDLDGLRSALADEMKESLENYVGETSESGLVQDYAYAFIFEVNYHEIAEHYVSDIDVWSAGWNMPGYMPDNPPALFLGWDQARDYLVEELERALEELEEGAEDPGYAEVAERLIHKAPGNAEYGQTIGAYHWFLTKGV